MQGEAELSVAYLVVASIIAYILLSRLLWRGKRDWVFIGIGYMILALVFQYLAQQAPFIVLLLGHLRDIMKFNELVSSIIKSNIFLVSIYVGSLAGVFQEVARYFAVKDRAVEASLYIGYGFALIDIAVAVIDILVISIIPSSLNPSASAPITMVGVISLVGLLLQPLVSFLFHPGASMMLRGMQASEHGLRGLAVTITAHVYMDSFNAYLNSAVLYGIINSYSAVLELSLVYFASIIIVPVLIFIYGLRILMRIN
ncbi:hypothetical protein [Caldivirga maquilingensis]|uniref:Uncharacterized protein n=1 Tax=Caldivirga maquilingensis (strain ATCC 700844 / DSM 13496 / JCM 10307 / IC-167) TaxID=397948 RepID=A8MBZ2_CALMQ|nr:hypothetical protein [Caldivirga maquilingensis]ABW01335.1 hypothetical protein Cmaq_0490 [Caldivirga maquilingensis IC-167]